MVQEVISIIKWIVFKQVFTGLIVCTPMFGFGQIISQQDGPWENANTWIGSVIPQTTDDVLIRHQVSLTNQVVTINSLTLDNTLAPTSLNIGPTGTTTLIVVNDLNINSTVNLDNDMVFAINANSTVAVNGNVTLIKNNATPARASIIMTSGRMSVGGNFTINYDLANDTNQEVTLQNDADLAVIGTLLLDFNNDDPDNNNDLTFHMTGTSTITAGTLTAITSGNANPQGSIDIQLNTASSFVVTGSSSIQVNEDAGDINFSVGLDAGSTATFRTTGNLVLSDLGDNSRINLTFSETTSLEVGGNFNITGDGPGGGSTSTIAFIDGSTGSIAGDFTATNTATHLGDIRINLDQTTGTGLAVSGTMSMINHSNNGSHDIVLDMINNAVLTVGNLIMESTDLTNNSQINGITTAGSAHIIIQGNISFIDGGLTTSNRKNKVEINEGTLEIMGNFIGTGSEDPGGGRLVFPTGNNTLRLSGNVPQTIPFIENATGTNSDDNILQNLNINNSSGTVISLDPNIINPNGLQIRSSLSMQNGIVEPAGINFILTDNAVSNEGTTTSFVAGPVIKQGNTADVNNKFIFPVGKDGHWAPVELEFLTNADVFSVEHFRSPSPNEKSLGMGVAKVSALEYWDINRLGGSAAVSVTLHFKDACASQVPTFASPGPDNNFFMTRFDGTTWQKLTTSIDASSENCDEMDGDSETGFVRAAGIDAFSLFTFGSIQTGVLPIELIHFDVDESQNQLHFSWATATEINNDHFIIQGSIDSFNFNDLATIDGAGNSSQRIDYDYSIPSNKMGYETYFRLNQTDFDGVSSNSQVIFVNRKLTDVLRVFPNPVSELLHAELQNIEDCIMRIEIMDLHGRIQSSFYSDAAHNTTDINISSYEDGEYIISVTDCQSRRFTSRILKE